MAKSYGMNPKEAKSVKDDDLMGIESVPEESPQTTDLANMKRVKVGTLLKKERDRLTKIENKNTEQDATIEQLRVDSKLFHMSADTQSFSLDENKLPSPNNQKAHVHIDKNNLTDPVVIEGLKEQPVNPLDFDVEPKDMAEEGIELKNVCRDNTDTWSPAVDISYKSFPVTESQNSKWYIRVEAKQTRGADDTQLVLAVNGDRRVFQKNAKQNTSFTLSTYYNGAFNPNPIGVLTLDASSAGRNAGVSVQHVVVIDITSLFEKYPQYTDEQLKKILDESLPYISPQQSKTLGGVVTLENLMPNPTSTDGWEKGNGASDFSISGDTVSVTTAKSVEGFSFTGSAYKSLSNNHIKKCFARIGNISATNGYSFGINYGVFAKDKNYGILVPEEEWQQFAVACNTGDSTITFKPSEGITVTDITESLLDLWLSLNGYDDDTKKSEWCNEHIPPFEGTYDLWIGSIKDEHTITARCGEYTSSLTFKTVYQKQSVATQPYVDNALRDKADVITNDRRGASPLVLEDSDEEPLLDMTIFGKTEQFSTEGKNLLPCNNAKNGTVNGITWETLEDGSIHLYGTSTNSFTLNLVEESNPIILPIGTYMLSGNTDSQTNFFVRNANNFWNDKGNGAEFTYREPLATYVYISIASGKTVNYIVSPMIELGSSATFYEPYTGGKPSPSPDYPQEIHSSGESGSIGVNVGGKNLLENAVETHTTAGLTITVNADKSLTFSNIPSATVADKIGNIDVVSFRGQAISIPRTFIGGLRYYVHLIKNNNIYIYNWLNSNFNNTKIIPEDALKIQMGYEVSTAFSGTPKTLYPQVEVGSVATPYEPFKPIQTAIASTPNGLTKWNRIELRDGFYQRENASSIFLGSDLKWNYDSSKTKTVLAWAGAYHYGDFAGEGFNVYSSSFRAKTGDSVYYSDEEGVGAWDVNTGRIYVRINRDRLVSEDTEGVKAFFNENRVEFLVKKTRGYETWTPLSEAEQAQFKALKTYNPVTTIWTSDATDIYVKYRAETSRIVKQMAREIVKNEAIYEMGENYIKYANGTMECWGKINIDSTGKWETDGALFKFNYSGSNMNFPQPFVDEPNLTLSVQAYPSASSVYFFAVSTSKINTVGLHRTDRNGTSCKVHYHAIGRWK